MLPEFRNEPFTDFSDRGNRAAFEQALDQAGRAAGGHHALLIDGERVTTGATIESRNPCASKEVVAHVAKGGPPEAEAALDAATAAFGRWSRTDARERAGYLLRAAAILRRRKHEFSAVMCLEVGKSWAEADGDTAEAIDFLDFYGREMLRIAAGDPVTPVPGEWNELFYLPLGPCAVIPPWNFPLAILVGMTSAAIVTGNTVVLKPASDSAWIAAKFVELMEETRLPRGVLNFVPGGGNEVGETLVKSPRTRLIAFTGSKAVGLRIHHLAATPDPACRWIKRTILEMGGKDAILVDDDVDLDEAAAWIVQSAFGFQGQKCSACSRVIVHDSVHDELAGRIVERAEKLKMGDTRSPDVSLGAVVNERAQKSILDYVEVGKREGRLLTGGTAGPKDGSYVVPTVFGDVPGDARIACEEIFGPVLAIVRCRDWEDGLRIANSTEYGLTGAAISRNRQHLERARREFHVGNLYLNRKCTGALVGGHPFGGFNMSGTDSKAGGRDYLGLFLQAKSVSERL